MKSKISILLFGITIYSCTTEKTVVKEQPIKIQPMTRYNYLESQHELAVMMRSWTQEQREVFRRKYVYSEVNIYLKNGDTLTVK